MPRILLVEDNEMNRDMLVRRLSRRGFDVSVAEDGAEGIEKAKAEMPDLILMDMRLPVMDGYEATRLLKQDGETKSIPILGLSAHAMSGDAQKALDAGCDDYDTKPVDLHRLVEKLQSLLQKASMTQTTVSSLVSGESVKAPSDVLIVDTEPTARDLLSRRVAALELSYDLASTVEQGEHFLEGKQYKVVLLASQLPQPAGALLLRRIAELPETSLVVTFAEASDDDIVRYLKLGADDYLLHPFRPEIVDSRLNAALSRSQAGLAQVGVHHGRAERLVRSFLPPFVREEWTAQESVSPRRLDSVALLYGEVLNLQPLLDGGSAEETIALLAELSRQIEEAAERHELELIRGLGESWLVAGGLTGPPPPVAACIRAAREMVETAGSSGPFKLRTGVHIGSALAGLVGVERLHFDLWGGSIRTVAQVARYGLPDSVTVSDAAWSKVSSLCRGESLGKIADSSGGEMEIYRLEGLPE